MSEMWTYTYTVLRYVHDTTTGEFVNVGVALHAPEARYASALCRGTHGRLSKVFPGINPGHFKSQMRFIQARFEELGERLNSELPLAPAETVAELARHILPTDDSSLQWSPVGAGRTTDPAATLERLYERMVMQYDDRPALEARSDEDVWRHFKRNLESKQILRYFEPRTIAVDDDEIEFDYTWKNGVVHCLEPISFDLSSAESIREKAHRWLGRITSVAGAREDFQLYFLVGQPKDDALTSAFEGSLSILRKIQVPCKIVREYESEALTDELAAQVREHIAASSS